MRRSNRVDREENDSGVLIDMAEDKDNVKPLNDKCMVGDGVAA